MPSPRVQRFIAFALVYSIWGSTYLAIRYAILTIPVFLMAGARFVIAGIVLYLWARLRDEAKPTLLHWRNTAIIGVLLLCFGNGGVVWAEQIVPSGITALLVATVPLWLVLLNWLRPHGTRPNAGVIAGIFVGLAGVITLVGIDALHGHSTINPIGALVLVGTSLVWAVGSLFARTAILPSPVLTTALEMLIAGVILLFVSVVTGELHNFDWRAISRISFAAFLYLVTFGSIVAYTAYTWLVRNTSPAAVGTYAYVNPVVAVFLGWFIANEPVTHNTLIGATIIITAVALITTTAPKLPATTPSALKKRQPEISGTTEEQTTPHP